MKPGIAAVAAALLLATTACGAQAPGQPQQASAAAARTTATSAPTVSTPASAPAKQGHVVVWGAHEGATLAAGKSSSPAPIPVPGLDDVVSLASSDGVAVVRSDGTVWHWGERRGAGDASQGTDAAPTKVQGVSGAVKVVTGLTGGFLVLTSSGNVYQFGQSDRAEDGIHLSKTDHYNPTAVQVPNLSGITDIAENTALDRTGTVWVWGCSGNRGVHGLLDGSYGSADVCVAPTAPTSIPKASMISERAVLTPEGKVWDLEKGAFRTEFPHAKAVYSVPGYIFASADDGKVWLSDGDAPAHVVPGPSNITGVTWGYTGAAMISSADGSGWILGGKADDYPEGIAPAGEEDAVKIPGSSQTISVGEFSALIEN